VLVGARRRGGQAAIEVWDTGCGIPEEVRAKSIEPYFRAIPTGGPEGEGLGLGIVRQLVENNGLRLAVRSTVGKGSVFVVEGLVIAALPLTNK